MTTPSQGTARLIAYRIRNRIAPEPVFAGESPRVREDDVFISTIGRRAK